MAVQRGYVVWGAILAVGAVIETHGIRNPGQGDTLSEFTRVAFGVHTKPGAVAFAAGWGIFSAWFVHHILPARR